MNDDIKNVEAVDLSPTRAELIARVRARGRQIRARRRLGVASVAALVVVAIAAPAIAIATRSTSRHGTVATSPARKGDFFVAVVAGSTPPPCRSGTYLTPVTAACVSLGRILVTAKDVQSASVRYDETLGGWLVEVRVAREAIARLATAVGHRTAIFVSGKVWSRGVNPAISGTTIAIVGDFMGRADAIALATMIAGRPPVHVDAEGAVTASIELTRDVLVAGSTVRGTIVVDNNTDNAVTLERPGQCGGKWAVVLTNASVPADVAFSQECSSHRTVLVPGGNRFPFDLSTTYMGCSNSTGPLSAGVLRCLPAGGIPPLPPGKYRAVVVDTFQGSFPTPPPVTIDIVAAQPAQPALGRLQIQTGARGIRLLVPSGWSFAAADAGGSGSKSTWSSPADPNESISGFTGVEVGSWWETDGIKGSINPRAVIPAEARIQRVSYNTFLYQFRAQNGYTVDGVWIAEIVGGLPSAYVSARTQLPSALHKAATTIINRFISDTNAALNSQTHP